GPPGDPMVENLVGTRACGEARMALDQPLEDELGAHAQVIDIDAAEGVEIVTGFRSLACLVLFRKRLERNLRHVAALLEGTVFVQHVSHAPRHTGGEVASGLTEHDHRTAGHVLAAVVAHAFYHRGGTRVTHRKALATDTG